MIKIMFECLGKICRSPLAEAVLVKKAKELKLDLYVESCGTAGYHVGESPDKRTIEVAQKHGVPISHKAQKLSKQHFNSFDYLLVMDKSNLNDALKITPQDSECEMFMMRDFDSVDRGSAVVDPWYGDESDFEICYQTVDRCTDGFIHFLVEKHKLGLS